MIITPPDYKNPEWEDAGRIHEWKNYISKEIADMWHTFTDNQQQALARQAEKSADNEEWG